MELLVQHPSADFSEHAARDLLARLTAAAARACGIEADEGGPASFPPLPPPGNGAAAPAAVDPAILHEIGNSFPVHTVRAAGIRCKHTLHCFFPKWHA